MNELNEIKTKQTIFILVIPNKILLYEMRSKPFSKKIDLYRKNFARHEFHLTLFKIRF